MDKLVNSILGRPAATAGIDHDRKNVLRNLTTSDDHGSDCLNAAHNIVTIINHITHKIYDKKQMRIPIVEKFLQDIETWKQQLPESIKSPSLTRRQPYSGQLSVRKGAVGAVHVSCLYYFAVTLVTRPILMSTLTAQPEGEPVHSPHSHLAKACLDAAVYLSQTCVDALKTGLLQGNMCIMK